MIVYHNCDEWRERCLAERKSHIFVTVMSATYKVSITFSERSKPDFLFDSSLFPLNRHICTIQF